MKTIKITGLTDAQADAIYAIAENGNLQNIINEILEARNISNVELDILDERIDGENNEEYIISFKLLEEDEPGYEPEDCICKDEVEKNDIEYTPDFTSSEDKESCICDHCGRTQ